MQSPIVASLAILMVNWDENKRDYLQNFASMLAEIIRVSPEETISVQDLRTKFDDRFGFLLPQNVMKRLLKRLEKQGFITRRKDNTYSPNRKKLSKLNFDTVQQDVLEKYDGLIARLTDFVRTTYKVEWPIEQAEAALQNYLSENQIQ